MKTTKKKKIVIAAVAVSVIAVVTGVILLGIYFGTRVDAVELTGMPTYYPPAENYVTVDRESDHYLGHPDNGVILMSYFASFLIAGTFLSVGSCLSACTKSQIVAFVLTMMACILLTFLGSDALANALSGMATEKMLKLFNSFGFLVHYLSITRGVLDLRDIIFFASFDSVFLFATVIVLERKKAA